jgi:hypothetical protein
MARRNPTNPDTPDWSLSVAGHCRYATALNGRHISLLQTEDAYRGIWRV